MLHLGILPKTIFFTIWPLASDLKFWGSVRQNFSPWEENRCSPLGVFHTNFYLKYTFSFPSCWPFTSVAMATIYFGGSRHLHCKCEVSVGCFLLKIQWKIWFSKNLSVDLWPLTLTSDGIVRTRYTFPQSLKIISLVFRKYLQNNIGHIHTYPRTQTQGHVLTPPTVMGFQLSWGTHHGLAP